jgi:hypothetical protein
MSVLRFIVCGPSPEALARSGLFRAPGLCIKVNQSQHSPAEGTGSRRL